MKLSRVSFLALMVFAILLMSCGGGSGKGGGTKKYTSRTGRKVNDSKGWFFSKKPKKEKAYIGMVFVEGGTFTMGLVKDDVMHDWNSTPKRIQVRSFYIGDTEVTNYDYREYVTWLNLVFPTSDPNYKNIYTGALPDTLVWRNELSRNGTFEENYFRAPQFDYYPVVGVSWLQAQRFCDWLTDRANETALMNKGIVSKDLYTDESQNTGANHFNAEKYQANDPSLESIVDADKAAKESGIKNPNTRVQAANRSSKQNLVPKFRLPTEVEWEYAALALPASREYNQYQEKIPEIEVLRKRKGRDEGQFQANFKSGGIGDYSGIGAWGNDGGAIPMDVRSFPANDFGIYGMYGNVAEWVADVYRPIIDTEANDFNYFRGNVYESKIKNPDGSNKIIEEGGIIFDTLADGRVLYKGLPGHYDREVIEDARNFRDGDRRSSLDVESEAQKQDSSYYNYYNSPVRSFRVTDDGRVIMNKDADNERTTDISDEIRVVKGGSWKDTHYWLDPAQRRYMHQGEATDWVGFRVAQDHLGNETSGKRRKRGVNTKP